MIRKLKNFVFLVRLLALFGNPKAIAVCKAFKLLMGGKAKIYHKVKTNE